MKPSISVKAIVYGISAVVVALALFLLILGCYAISQDSIFLGATIGMAITIVLIVGFVESLRILKYRTYRVNSSLENKISFIIQENEKGRIRASTAITEIKDLIKNTDENILRK